MTHTAFNQTPNPLLWFALKRLIRLQFPDVRQISTAELADWLDQPERPQPIVLDARTADEYAVSHLPNAQRVDPNAVDFAALSNCANMPIVVYCSVGYRSSRLSDRLQAAGFNQVANLEGSIFEWANEGRPLFQAGEAVKQVHPYNATWGRLLRRELWSGT
ncbi:rhodanese-like domain-containing protein [Leptolyngbya sp. FACHB-36]|uniref:rhodanese-like domain-containing protein n=1 Tax=Leptolyngbya sp. FACHB-36 TaxID=2692808 RepID=UPI0016803710|nr:rhodanese-like domain-containing protein [Leptolyngbya sp. FACHB-36]MBD2022259.1 rhodanese-like domain-containing protein [Leptolyngbya sp. FACHB-36]